MSPTDRICPGRVLASGNGYGRNVQHLFKKDAENSIIPYMCHGKKEFVSRKDKL